MVNMRRACFKGPSPVDSGFYSLRLLKTEREREIVIMLSGQFGIGISLPAANSKSHYESMNRGVV